MYRDLAQWSDIRDQILRKGVSIRQVVRETGISHKTVRKMLDHPLPQPYGREAADTEARPSYRLSPADTPGKRYIAALGPPLDKGHLRAYPRYGGFRGSYSSVTDYARTIAQPDKVASGNMLTTC